MFYEPATQTSGLPHNPFTACCVPRPIGWISTVSTAGVHNLAPFAQFQNVTFEPPTVLFSHCGWPRKDTLVNALETGEFVWNMATYDLREKVAGSAATFPPDVDEFDVLDIDDAAVEHRQGAAGRGLAGALRVPGARVDRHPELDPRGPATMVIAHVVGIHIRDDALTEDGRVDVAGIRPLARLGYLDYTAVSELFEVHAAPPNGRYQPDPNLRADPSGLFHMPEVQHGG